MTAQDATMSYLQLDAEAVARLNALAQGAKPERSTVIQDGNRTVRIITDRNGNTRIERTGPAGSDVAPAAPPVPGIPGISVSPPVTSNDIPPEAANMLYALLAMIVVIVVGWPIARALGRRIERSGKPAELSPAATDQLRRIEQAVEAMAIEVERISESQRFIAKLQSGSSAERV